MPRTSQRGGPQTRARILEAAHWMFLERGYDAVTVADVAREAGVSSVTVFKHFPRKEDLFLDRTDDAVELIHSAVRDRAPGVDVLESLRATDLPDLRRASAALRCRRASLPFFRTVAGAPALVARAREIAAELQQILAEELARDDEFRGDAHTARGLPHRRLQRGAGGDRAAHHRGRTAGSRRGRPSHAPGALFDALRNGVAPSRADSRARRHFPSTRPSADGHSRRKVALSRCRMPDAVPCRAAVPCVPCRTWWTAQAHCRPSDAAQRRCPRPRAGRRFPATGHRPTGLSQESGAPASPDAGCRRRCGMPPANPSPVGRAPRQLRRARIRAAQTDRASRAAQATAQLERR